MTNRFKNALECMPHDNPDDISEWVQCNAIAIREALTLASRSAVPDAPPACKPEAGVEELLASVPKGCHVAFGPDEDMEWGAYCYDREKNYPFGYGPTPAAAITDALKGMKGETT